MTTPHSRSGVRRTPVIRTHSDNSEARFSSLCRNRRDNRTTAVHDAFAKLREYEIQCSEATDALYEEQVRYASFLQEHVLAAGSSPPQHHHHKPPRARTESLPTRPRSTIISTCATVRFDGFDGFDGFEKWDEGSSSGTVSSDGNACDTCTLCFDQPASLRVQCCRNALCPACRTQVTRCPWCRSELGT